MTIIVKIAGMWHALLLPNPDGGLSGTFRAIFISRGNLLLLFQLCLSTTSVVLLFSRGRVLYAKVNSTPRGHLSSLQS